MTGDQQIIVIDNGTGVMKAGFSGGDEPDKIFPTQCSGLEAQSSKKTYKYIGNEVNTMLHNHDLNVIDPIERGSIVDWDAMEIIWTYIFTSLVSNNTDNLSVLLTEPVHVNQSNRELMIQIMFETFECRSAYICLQDILALFSTGKKSGVHLNLGEGVTSVVSIFEGYAIPYGARKLGNTGKDLTEVIRQYLNLTYPSHMNKLTFYQQSHVSQDVKQKFCALKHDQGDHHIMSVTEFVEEEEKKKMLSYQLPDGTTLQFTDENQQVFSQLVECLLIQTQPEFQKGLKSQCFNFHSKSVNLPALIYDTVMSCDHEFHDDFLSNIVISGGGACVKHFSDRLFSALSSSFLPSAHPAKIISSPNPTQAAWFGGSILSSLSVFQNAWITKDDYNECGPPIVHRKCIS